MLTLISFQRLKKTVSRISEKEVKGLHRGPLPKHVALIMDGNRRWATRHFFKARKCAEGHWAGAETLRQIVEEAPRLGIEWLTVYAFSTENWQRPADEVRVLMEIFSTYLRENCQRMVERGVSFHTIGNLDPFSDELKGEVERVKKETERGKALQFIVALNYGGRDELLRASQKMAHACREQGIDPEAVDEEGFRAYLDTALWPDPDLLIRTSGEMRLSNFLPWQLAYTEIYVTKHHWPDFTPKRLLRALYEFQKRQRRRGR